MEHRVLDEHVRRISLERDIVVSAGHVPIAHRDIVRVERVYAVGVLCLRLESFKFETSESVGDGGRARAHAVVRRAVDVYVVQEQVFRGVDRHRPELALHEAEALEDGVRRVADDEVDRPAGLVRDPVCVFVPHNKKLNLNIQQRWQRGQRPTRFVHFRQTFRGHCR